MTNEEFFEAHKTAKSQIEDSKSEAAITRFLNATMNFEPIDPLDALVAAYALNAAATVRKGLGAMGIKRNRGDSYKIDELPKSSRDAVIGICLLYRTKQIKLKPALDEIAQHLPSADTDRKTLEKLLKSGVKNWGGIVDLMQSMGELPEFKTLFKNLPSVNK